MEKTQCYTAYKLKITQMVEQEIFNMQLHHAPNMQWLIGQFKLEFDKKKDKTKPGSKIENKKQKVQKHKEMQEERVKMNYLSLPQQRWGH